MRGGKGALRQREEPVKGSEVHGRAAQLHGWSPECRTAAWELPNLEDNLEDEQEPGHAGPHKPCSCGGFGSRSKEQ